MKNAVKEKMLAGERTLGTFFELGAGSVAECLGFTGLDYIIIDNEHGPFDPLSTQEFLRAAKLYHITPFARAQEISRPAILKLLDIGVMGVVVPCVKTVAEVERIAEYGKYAPIGARGVASAAGSGFWYEDYAAQGLRHYFSVSNSETLLLPQCETVECLDHLEEIVRVEGIDGIYVGPFDLSTALGKPGDFSAPEVRDALASIPKICKAANKLSFIFAATEEAARQDFALGYGSVTYGTDASVLVDAYRAAVRGILS